MKKILFLIILAAVVACTTQTKKTDAQHEAMSATYFNEYFADSLLYKINLYRGSLDLAPIPMLVAQTDTLVNDSADKEYHLLTVRIDTNRIIHMGFETVKGDEDTQVGWYSNGTLIWCSCETDYCELRWTNTWTCVGIPGRCGTYQCKIHGLFTNCWIPPTP